MSPLNEVALELSEQAREQAHDIQWGIIGERLAHGKCAHCGSTVRLEVNRRGKISTRSEIEGLCSGQA